MVTATSVGNTLPETSGCCLFPYLLTRSHGHAGVMTAWAWAEHRILDAIEQVVPEIDTSRVGVVGCSRYGKTALAAAIFDQRVRLPSACPGTAS